MNKIIRALSLGVAFVAANGVILTAADARSCYRPRHRHYKMVYKQPIPTETLVTVKDQDDVGKVPVIGWIADMVDPPPKTEAVAGAVVGADGKLIAAGGSVCTIKANAYSLNGTYVGKRAIQMPCT